MTSSPHVRLAGENAGWYCALPVENLKSTARFLLRSRDPVERLVRSAVLSQKEAQLGRMFLDVAQGVQLELEKAHRLPPPPRENHLALRLLIGQREQRGLALLAQPHQISMKFLLGVGLFGKDPCWSKLILGEGGGRSESFQGAREIQVEPEQGVMDKRPEGWVCWGFRVTPEESSPQHAGAGKQGIFQHVDGRAELPPQSSAQRRLYWVFSHTFPPFVLLCSQTTT